MSRVKSAPLESFVGTKTRHKEKQAGGSQKPGSLQLNMSVRGRRLCSGDEMEWQPGGSSGAGGVD